MGMTYFKRYRMDMPLHNVDLSVTNLESGFELIAWKEDLLREHALIKHQCFENEIDSSVFPCLSNRRGCLRLMQDIARRSNFVPEATWLLTKRDAVTGRRHSIGTIQGLRDEKNFGAIQNIGILPEFRGLGLGSALIHRALAGFQSVGCPQAHLEVTVQNMSAIRLYERIGFRKTETVFKVADVVLV